MRRAWLWGIAAEALLVAVPLIAGRFQKPVLSPEFAAFEAYWDSVDRGLKARPPEATPEQKAALLQLLSDSFGIKVERRGDTIHVDGPPAMDSAAANIMRGLKAASLAALIYFLVVYTPIPLYLMAVTIIWLLARRRAHATSTATATAA